MADQAQAAAHWDAAYAPGDDTRSWFEKHPVMSLRMLTAAGVLAADAPIDWAAAHPPWPGRCWIADSVTSPSLTSPRPGCRTRGIASVRGLTRFTG